MPWLRKGGVDVLDSTESTTAPVTPARPTTGGWVRKGGVDVSASLPMLPSMTLPSVGEWVRRQGVAVVPAATAPSFFPSRAASITEAGLPLTQRLGQIGRTASEGIASILPPVAIARNLQLRQAERQLNPPLPSTQAGWVPPRTWEDAARQQEQYLQQRSPFLAQTIAERQGRERQAAEAMPWATGAGRFVGGLAPFAAGMGATNAALGPAGQAAIRALPLLARAPAVGLTMAPTAGALAAQERANLGVTQGVPTTAGDVAKAGLTSAALAVPLGAAGEAVMTGGRAINQRLFQGMLTRLEGVYQQRNPNVSPEVFDQFRLWLRQQLVTTARAQGWSPETGPGVLRSAIGRTRIERAIRQDPMFLKMRVPVEQPTPPQRPVMAFAPPLAAPVRPPTVPRPVLSTPGASQMPATTPPLPVIAPRVNIAAPAVLVPPRTPATMGEAIALSSPSGTMSRQSRARANERLRQELFGQEGLQAQNAPQPTPAEALRRQAQQLRELASRGMKPKAHLRQAMVLEVRAQQLDAATPTLPAAAPGAPSPTPAQPTPQPTIPDFATTQEAEAFGRQHQGNAQVVALLQAKRAAYLRLADDTALSTDLRFQAAQAAQLPREALQAAGQGVEQPTPATVSAAPPVVAPSAVKQPWEMTALEYARSHVPGARAPGAGFTAQHRVEVKAALARRQPVPPAVLAEYPDLQSPTTAGPQRPRTQTELPGLAPPPAPTTALRPTTAQAPTKEERLASGVAEPSPAYGTSAPPFYSHLERTIEQRMPRRAPVAQVRGLLASAGVKQDELTWVLGDYLDGKVFIQQADLLQHIRANQVQVQEVVKHDAEIPSSLSATGTYRPGRFATTKFSDRVLPGGPLSRDTELLSESGWKRIDELGIGDIVMTRADDGRLEWAGVSATHRVFSDRLYHFQNQSIDMMTTANHQMVVKRRRRSSAGVFRTTAEQLWRMSECLVPLTGAWHAKSQKTLFGLHAGDVAEFVGWYLAEGSYKHRNGVKTTIQIAQCDQHNAANCRRLEALFDRLGLSWKWYGGAYGVGIRKMPIGLKELIHSQPTSAGKFVPPLFMQQGRDVIERLLSGLFLGDGHLIQAKGRRQAKQLFFSKSARLAGDVQALCLLSGKRASVRQRPSGIYVVAVCEKQWASIDDAKRAIVPYDDFAFCVTVKNHAIYVRRNGIAAFTGNSNYRELLLTWPAAPKEPHGRIERLINGKYLVSAAGLQARLFDTEAEAIAETQRLGEKFSEQTGFISPHFDEPNILAHVRFNDRVDANGRKTLFLEEVQSDWHQRGRHEGYGLSAQAEDVTLAGEAMGGTPVSARVPDAPFKTTWHELALKRMLRYAAENNYDQIAWTTGEQQAARYDLSKQISKVQITKDHNLAAYDLQGNQVINKALPINEKDAFAEVEAQVGKDVAQRLFVQPEATEYKPREVSGIDLKIGGVWLKRLYDVMLPSFLNKFGKRFGVQAGTTRIDTEEPTAEGDNTEKVTVHAFVTPPALRQSALTEGFAVFDKPQPGGTLPTGGARGNAPAVQPAQGPMPAPRLQDTHPAIATAAATQGTLLPDGHQSLPLELAVPPQFPHMQRLALRVIPITRAEADALQGVFVQFPDGHQGSATFQHVPEAEAASATGLQYFYKYDLPAGAAAPYTSTAPAPIQQTLTQQEMGRLEGGTTAGEGAPAPYNEAAERAAIQGEPPTTPQPLTPELRRRLAAAGLTQADVVRLARALFRQTRMMQTESQRLQQAIMEHGGIRAFAGGVEAEEYRAIPMRLRRTTGLPPDEMAASLQAEGFPYESTNDLLAAISEIKQLPTLTIKDFIPQAEETIFNHLDPKTRQALVEAQPTGAQMRRLRQAMRTDLGKQITKLAADAQAKRLTPRQVSQLAKLHRIQPGQTVTGPKGGTLEAPLSPADVRKTQAVVGSIRQLGPNAPPPVIPRGRAMVPYYPPGRFRDLAELQAGQGSGLSPRRAADVIDRGPMGPTYQKWVGLRNAEIAAGREAQALVSELHRIAGRLRVSQPDTEQVVNLLEGTSTGVTTPRATQTAAWIRQTNDDLIDRANTVLTALGRTPITKRQDYMTHITGNDAWVELRAALTGESVEHVRTLGDLVPRSLRVSSRFFRPREGGAYLRDPLRAFDAYARSVLRVIHEATPARQLEAHAAQLPMRARQYVRRVIRQTVAGEPGEIATAVGKPLTRVVAGITNRFSRGTVLGNLSSVVMQPWTAPAVLAELPASSPTSSLLTDLWRVRQAGIAAAWTWQGRGMAFAEQWSRTLQGRLVERLDPGILSDYRAFTDKLAGWMTGVDRAMVAWAFNTHYLNQRAEGLSHARAVEIADDVAARTQTEFLKSALPPAFNDEAMRALLPFQTTVNEVFNAFKQDVLRGRRAGPASVTLRAGQPPAVTERGPFQDAADVVRDGRVWRAAALWFGTVTAMAFVYDQLGLPRPRGIMDWIPGVSTFRGGPPPIKMVGDVVTGLGSPSEHEREKAWGDFWRSAGIIAIGPPTNQALKSGYGIVDVVRGASVTAAGRERFKIRGPAEVARAVAFGSWQTKAGQAYIQRGFQPEPLTPAERQQRKIDQRNARRHHPVIE